MEKHILIGAFWLWSFCGFAQFENITGYFDGGPVAAGGGGFTAPGVYAVATNIISGSTLSVATTIDAGTAANRLLIVCCDWFHNPDSPISGASCTNTSGQSGTLLVSTNYNSGGGCKTTMWGILNPPTGSQTVTFNWASQGASEGAVYVIALTNVQQTSTYNTAKACTNSAMNSVSLAVPSASNELIIGFSGFDDVTTPSVSGTGASLLAYKANTGNHDSGVLQQTGAAGNVTETWTWSGSFDGSIIGISIR